MPTTPSHIRYALGRIVNAASHPNALLYKYQQTKAEQKHLVRETETGEIALPPPSPASMIGRGPINGDSVGTKMELARKGKLEMLSGAVVEKPGEQGGNGGSRHVTDRRFMGLAILDTASIARFLRDGTKSARH